MASAYTLEFEKPLLELERQIEDLKRIGTERQIDIEGELAGLQGKLESLRAEIYRNLTPIQRVMVARHPRRPYTLDYLSTIFTDFIELHGDRLYLDDPAIVGGWARLGGVSVMVIGHQKGRDTKENLKRNFGMPHPEGYRKALRLMKLGAKFNAPIITLIDTPGAYPGLGAEERGQSEALARNILEMSILPAPTVAVVIGEGGSGGALALGVADRILMLENSVYSVISPEGCASILWRDPEKAPVAAAAMRMTAADQLELGVIDAIIDEPKDGAQADPGAAARAVKAAIITHLQRVSRTEPEVLLTSRYARLRSTGLVLEAEGQSPPLLEPVTLRGRIGRLLRIPGVRTPRWSEIWPSGADESANEGEN
jgi:acetyl-CoA carboxylase carboxyl transferase subunit alpha